MNQSIKVYVVRRSRCKNLILRYMPPDGQNYVERSAGTHLAREAERAAARWEKELNEGTYRPKSRISWAEFRIAFTETHLPSNRPRSQEKFETVFNSVENEIAPKDLKSLTALKIVEWQNKLRKAGHPDTTIKGYSGHLRVALRWGAEHGYLPVAPKITMPSVDDSQLMRGGPITTNQFAQLLRTVGRVIRDPKAAKELRLLLRGMFWGSLRLEEAINLHWSEGGFQVDLSGRRPMFRIKAGSEKGKKNRLLPIAPEFANLLLTLKRRQGFVFETTTATGRRPQVSNLSALISDIGRASGIQTQNDPVRFVTSHDLRRSFGTRWARLVKPITLMQMMRHSSITTTQKFYVALDAEETADLLYAALESVKKPLW